MNVKDLILKQPLYRPVEIAVTDFEDLKSLKVIYYDKKFTLRIGGFCSKCNSMTTFIRILSGGEHYTVPSINKVNKNLTSDQQLNLKYILYMRFLNKYEFINMLFECSRDKDHRMQVSFYLDKQHQTIQKIGQYPFT